MDQLSHRERVLLALDHKDTDRVPMDLCGSTCNMVDGLYFKVRDMLGIQGDIPPYRTGRTSSYYDERILNAFDTDFRHISIKSAKSQPITMHAIFPPNPRKAVFKDSVIRDRFNVGLKTIQSNGVYDAILKKYAGQL